MNCVIPIKDLSEGCTVLFHCNQLAYPKHFKGMKGSVNKCATYV